MDGRFRVELYTEVSAQPTTFTIKGSTSDVVEDIFVDADVPQFVFIEIEGPSDSQSLDSVEDIDSLTSTATVLLSKANVANDVASIRLNVITGTDIGGDITGDIELIERSGGGFSNIIDMDVAGDILGDILVDYGDIEDLNVGGSIGTVGDKSTISTGRHVLRLIADEIHANVTTDATFNTQYIKTNGSSSDGDFTGSLATQHLTDHGGPDRGIDIAGDLEADLEFSGFVSRPIDVAGKLASGHFIRIGTNLGGSGDTITLGANGLEGQIVVNASDTTGTWTGDVVVGSTTLSPEPYYTQTGLGGGAVGLALYGFHKTESEPDYDTTVISAIPTQVKIVHYGPVHRTTGLSGAGVVTVEKQPLGGGGWTDVSSNFVVDATTAHTGFNREILVKPTVGNSFENEMEYRIKPIAEKLVCGLVDDCPSDCPDVGWQEDYFIFEIDVP